MTGTIQAGGAGELPFGVEVTTDYPYSGEIRIRVTEAPDEPADLALRIPAWANDVTALVGGREAGATPGPDGYLHLERSWSAGDEVILQLPLRVRIVAGDPRIDAARGSVAFERGPLVYCFEGVDVPGETGTEDLVIHPDLAARPDEPMTIADQTVTPLAVRAGLRPDEAAGPWPYREVTSPDEVTPPVPADGEVRAVPYYAWANRGPTDMRVWVPVQR
jgi:hypothetical protein